MDEEIKKIIETDSPWHNPNNKDWSSKDGSLSILLEAEQIGLFQPPKLYYTLKRDFFDKLIQDPKSQGVIILRGPRRIGKTSTIKYIIKQLLDEKSIEGKNIIYLSLDKDELFNEEAEKKRFLRQLISTIITEYKKENSPLFIILDEVTFYKGWARAIKNIIDEGLVGKGVGIIATGSYSLDLSSAKRELAGRWGPLGDKFGGDVFFFPRKFVEVTESTMTSGFNEYLSHTIGRYSKRMGILEYLAGYQSEEDNINFHYTKILKELIEKYYIDLHILFEKTYLWSGGYPKSIFETIILPAEKGETTVSDARYRDDIYSLLVSDAKKFNLSEEITEKILSKISLPSYELSEKSFGIENIQAKEIEHYKKYLQESGLFMFLPRIRSKDVESSDRRITINSDSNSKMIVTDPAAYIACYYCSRKVENGILKKAQNDFNINKKISESLFESIVISHMAKSSTLNQPIMKKNIGYFHDEEEISDCTVWMINYKDEFVMFTVEAKSGNIDITQINRKSKLAQEKYGIKKLIVVANCNYIKVEANYSIIPIEIFLLLLF